MVDFYIKQLLVLMKINVIFENNIVDLNIQCDRCRSQESERKKRRKVVLSFKGDREING